MGRIRVMSEALASQVAAGEVVERPASVLKELIENSIDAGAKTITIDIRRGGVALMRVTDDGSGMSRDDAIVCIQRHATSKLSRLSDLMEITHLGFRGEALPSIASVSRFRLSTRERDSVEGTEVVVNGGEITSIKSSGVACGTTVEIEELFFNIPARRKFLRSEDVEYAHAEHQVRLHALAFPDVRFVLRKDNRVVYDLSGVTDKRMRITQLLGRDWAEKLIPVETTMGSGFSVDGFLMPLSEARKTRKHQFVFLNNRPIEDALISKAIREGIGGLAQGMHPSLFLYIDMEPSLVDVNVHPSKKEVRFRRPRDVIAVLVQAISEALAKHARDMMQKDFGFAPREYSDSEMSEKSEARDITDVTPVPVKARPKGPGNVAFDDFVKANLAKTPFKQDKSEVTPGADKPRIVLPTQHTPLNLKPEQRAELQEALLSGDVADSSQSSLSAKPTEPALPMMTMPLKREFRGMNDGHEASLGVEDGCAQPADSSKNETGSQESLEKNSSTPEAEVRDVGSHPEATENVESEGTHAEIEKLAEPIVATQPFEFKYLGLLHDKYMIWEGSDGMVLMNPKAALERILFERLIRDQQNEGVPTQKLLIPVVFDVDVRDFRALTDMIPYLEDSGFHLHPFGAKSFQVDAIPAFLELRDAKSFLLDLTDTLLATSFVKKAKSFTYKVFASYLSTKMVKEQDPVHADPYTLMRDLMACELPYCTAQNKPTLFPLSLFEIERKLGKV